jgi:hypothetical protein
VDILPVHAVEFSADCQKWMLQACDYLNPLITVQKEQGVRLVSLMQREIIIYMASAMFVSSY